MSFLELFVVAFLILFVWKLIQAYLIVRKAREQARKIFEQMYGGADTSQTAADREQRKPGWSTPAERKKKIDPEVGEYVKFQEISVAETTETTEKSGSTTTTTTTTTVVEQQVIDAEWEDI